MARLSSDNRECPSFLDLQAGDLKRLLAGDETQLWQSIALHLSAGQRQISTGEHEDCLLCRTPEDEVETLIDNLEALATRRKDKVYFEPSEPTFELSFERTRAGGIKVEAWLDAGNGASGIYTWDACGIRFYTNDELLVSFIEEIRKDFPGQ